MPWYLDNTRIFVTDKSSDHKQIVSKLQPVNNGSIFHTFGYENRAYKITAYVVSAGHLAALIAMTKDGNTHAFIQPNFSGDVIVNSLTIKETNAIAQTFDTTVDCAETVYIVDLDMYLNDDP